MKICDDLYQVGVARSLVNGLVKLHIGFVDHGVEVGFVIRADFLPGESTHSRCQLVLDPFEPGPDLRSHPGRCQLATITLQLGPDGVDLDQFVPVKDTDFRSPVGNDVNKVLGLELSQSFPDRRAAHSKGLAEIVLNEA